MESGRKFVVLNRPARGESSRSVFGLDIRVLRMVYTLAVCYLLFRLRAVLLSIAAYILLPAVEVTYRFLTHKRHKRGALAPVFLIVVTILFSVGGVVAYYAFQQAGTLAQQEPTLLEPDAIRHVQLPKFLRPWDPQIRRLLQNFREAHGRDLLGTLTSMTVQLLATVGSMLSLLVIFVFSFLLLKNGEGYRHLLWLVVVFVLVRMLVDYVLQPMLMGSAGLGISPIDIIFGALAGETIAGVPGLLLSVPAMATLRLLYRHAVKVRPGQRPNSWEPGPAIPY